MNDLPRAMPPPSAPTMTEQNNYSYVPPTVMDDSARNELLRQGYTPGLVQAILNNRIAFAHCFWIIDNSGSMQTQDGHMIIDKTHQNSHKLQFISCSRWKEMVQTVEYHVNLAALTRAPTTFRLLNHPGRQAGSQIFTMATTTTSSNNLTQSMIDDNLAVALHTMTHTQPGGVTPLTEHIHAIRQSIEEMLPQLYANGQKVAIVLATDGLPTDRAGNSNPYTNQQFEQALKSLEGLPIWIVVRLCTDEEAIVNFWNELDSQLEYSLEVLDDYASEGQEIHQLNPWLTYGLPLHRMREMGFYNRLFDLLDEQPLSKSDVRDFLQILFGPFDAPDPDLQWDPFCTTVERIQQQQLQQRVSYPWNPVHQKCMPWIDIRKLRQHNRKSTGWFW